MVASRNDNEDHQVRCPMIIAMKGASSSKKIEIAIKLASFLQYPLFDEGDIILALQNSIPSFSSTDELYSDLPFQIVCQISTTQISLKLNVILNCDLSQRAHFEHLLQLASSMEACLLVIDCEAQNGAAAYDVGHVQKLNIDIRKPFVVEEFAPEMLHAAKLSQEIHVACVEN